MIILRIAVMVALPGLYPVALSAQQCPLSPGLGAGFHTQSRSGGPVLFRSGLAVNADGAPNAYHRVLGAKAPDPGTLHICNGVNVLELRNGKMVNRYPQIGGKDEAASRAASAACKADVYALQEKGFPACSTGTCLRIFGFDADPRVCDTGSRNMQCGVPRAALGADGKPTGFWISTLSWFDPNKARNDPARYPDPRYIPHFVLPGGEGGKFAQLHGIRLGDIALVAWHGRAVFAAFADAGPSDKLGEASPALINRLRGVADTDTLIGAGIDGADPATTLLLPGTHGLLGGGLPANAAELYRIGIQALAQAGGLVAFSACPGLGGGLIIANQ